jgi:hypothetical protein
MINIYNSYRQFKFKVCFIVMRCDFFHVFQYCTDVNQYIIHYHPGGFNVLFSCLPLGTSVYCNIWLLNRMEGMSQSTNYVIKKIHSTVICLLMTNFANIQFIVLITLIIKFNLEIKLNTEMVKLLSKLSFTICDNIHWLLI